MSEWKGPERRKPLIQAQLRREKERLEEEKRYEGYLFWCSEGCGFVSRKHQCEQWTHLSYIPPAAAETLRKMAREQAETADERVRELVGALELCREYIWLNHGCSIGCLYGDDGERQCNNWTQHRPLDFKRQPISEILSELRAAALRKLGKE